MPGLINTAEGYAAQMIGQLMLEKAHLLGEIDKLQAQVTQQTEDPATRASSPGHTRPRPKPTTPPCDPPSS